MTHAGGTRKQGNSFIWCQAGWQGHGRSPGWVGSQKLVSQWRKPEVREAAVFPWGSAPQGATAVLMVGLYIIRTSKSKLGWAGSSLCFGNRFGNPLEMRWCIVKTKKWGQEGQHCSSSWQSCELSDTTGQILDLEKKTTLWKSSVTHLASRCFGFYLSDTSILASTDFS